MIKVLNKTKPKAKTKTVYPVGDPSIYLDPATYKRARQLMRARGIGYLCGNAIVNPKTSKNLKEGWNTLLLHLAPASLSGFNTCPFSTAGCREACLNEAGQGAIVVDGVNRCGVARIARTRFFFDHPNEFLSVIHRQITNAKKGDLPLAVRLNGTSDIPWEEVAPDLFEVHNDVAFYDYSKTFTRLGKTPSNYVLTYSYTGSRNSWNVAKNFLTQGGRVAVVYGLCKHVSPRCKCSKALPAKHPGPMGGAFPVVDGDKHDLTFLRPQGSIIGLRTKGKANKDSSGFVTWVS